MLSIDGSHPLAPRTYFQRIGLNIETGTQIFHRKHTENYGNIMIDSGDLQPIELISLGSLVHIPLMAILG